MSFRTLFRGFVCCTSGVAAIEFAMVGLFAISLILGVFEFGRALFLRNQMAFAADIATRHVLLNPPTDDSDLQHLEAAIRDSLAIDYGRLEVTVGLPSVDGVVPISLSQPLTLLVPDLFQQSITLSVNRRVPLR